MSSSKRPTDADYEDLADSYEAEPPRADEILGIEVNPARLPIGRPAAGSEPAGKTPALPVRLPPSIRGIMKRHVEAGTVRSESELVREALLEYFERHPVNAGG